MPDRTNLKVGKPDTTPSAPSHVEGVRQGNQPGGLEKMPGFYMTGQAGAGKVIAKGTARRSTGVSHNKRNPIDPSMPNLSPA